MALDTDEANFPPAVWRESSIHSAYLRILMAVAERQGLQTGIQAPVGTRLLPFMDIVPMLDAIGAVRQPGQAIKIGTLIPASGHGPMGYAVVSASTIGQAMETIARYAPMRNRLFAYQCRANKVETVLSLKPRFDLADYRTFGEMATSSTLFRMILALVGEDAAHRMRFDVTWQDSGEEKFGIPMRFSQPVTALHVPHELSQWSAVTADAKQYALACRSCQQELDVLNGSISAKLRAIMPTEQQEWLTLEAAANRFAMSTRTLIRKLAAEEFSYQALLDEAKGEMACWYLRNTSMPISGVAERLGFLSDANFSRSFKRWRGTTPLEYRKAQRVAIEDRSTVKQLTG